MMVRRTFFSFISGLFIANKTPHLDKVNVDSPKITLSYPDVDQVNVEKFYMDKWKCWRLEITTRLKNGQLWAIHTDLNDKSISTAYSILIQKTRRKIKVDRHTEFRFSKNLKSNSWAND